MVCRCTTKRSIIVNNAFVFNLELSAYKRTTSHKLSPGFVSFVCLPLFSFSFMLFWCENTDRYQKYQHKITVGINAPFAEVKLMYNNKNSFYNS